MKYRIFRSSGITGRKVNTPVYVRDFDGTESGVVSKMIDLAHAEGDRRRNRKWTVNREETGAGTVIDLCPLDDTQTIAARYSFREATDG